MQGGFSRAMRKRGGLIFEERNLGVRVLSDAAQTLTADILAHGVISSVPSAARNFTLDTAANILASDVVDDMDIGDSLEFTIANHAEATHAITVVVATGITNAGAAAALVVAAATSRKFLLTKTSATAMTIMGL